MKDKKSDEKRLPLATLERIIFSAGAALGIMEGLLMDSDIPLFRYFTNGLPLAIPCFLVGYMTSREVKKPLALAVLFYGGHLVGEALTITERYL